MILKKLIQGRCFICYQPLQLIHHGICSFCSTFIPNMPDSCRYCGLVTLNHDRCYRCQNIHPPWQRLIAVSSYDEPLRWLINRMKFNGHTELGYALSRLLLLKWLSERRAHGLAKPQLVLPVPLYRLRQWRRGFNQSALLAKPLAHWLNAKYSETLLVRKERRDEQKKLSAELRKSNLKEVFCCTGKVAGKRILLVDDIVTTGSTIHEICNILKMQNPQEIQVICLCRTL